MAIRVLTANSNDLILIENQMGNPPNVPSIYYSNKRKPQTLYTQPKPHFLGHFSGLLQRSARAFLCSISLKKTLVKLFSIRQLLRASTSNDG
jgi:hypothetical protein